MNTAMQVTMTNTPIPSQTLMRQLARAVEDGKALRIFYRKGDGEPVELRRVSPYEVKLSTTGSGHVLVAWDHDREGIRNFRVSSMRGVCDAPDVSYVEPR